MDEENNEIAHARMVTREGDGGFWPDLEFGTHRRKVSKIRNLKVKGILCSEGGEYLPFYQMLFGADFNCLLAIRNAFL
jgi:hypothetical protein